MICDSRLTIATAALALCLASSALSQGALTPPGAPAPTMKSLAQIEPRTPVDAAHTPGSPSSVFIISQPGSYYLTTNLVASNGMSGITFRTNDITLDLNGFALMGSGTGNGNGIATPLNLTNLVIRNGTIRGFNTGIDTTGNHNTLVENVLAAQNLNYGMTLGVDSTVRDCKALGNAGAAGITAEDQSLVSHCTANNCASGIHVSFHCLVEDCVAANNQGDGFVVFNDSVITGNESVQNSGSGIHASGSNARIDNNHCVNNNIGVLVDFSNANNLVIRNSLISNTNDFSIPSGNKVGPFVSDPTSSSANAWANILTSLLL